MKNSVKMRTVEALILTSIQNSGLVSCFQSIDEAIQWLGILSPLFIEKMTKGFLSNNRRLAFSSH
jgi:hypothetical protein